MTRAPTVAIPAAIKIVGGRIAQQAQEVMVRAFAHKSTRDRTQVIMCVKWITNKLDPNMIGK
jgi:hypothetical protein